MDTSNSKMTIETVSGECESLNHLEKVSEPQEHFEASFWVHIRVKVPPYDFVEPGDDDDLSEQEKEIWDIGKIFNSESFKKYIAEYTNDSSNHHRPRR
jgi:hypothetical protein